MLNRGSNADLPPGPLRRAGRVFSKQHKCLYRFCEACAWRLVSVHCKHPSEEKLKYAHHREGILPVFLRGSTKLVLVDFCAGRAQLFGSHVSLSYATLDYRLN